MDNKDMKSVKIVVATHKKFLMPKDTMYLPLEVGAATRKAHTGYQQDDTGGNISSKNAGFCELTGLYWAWKNLNNDYIGLVHYRRYFTRYFCLCRDEKERIKKILTLEEASKLLDSTDVILPRKRNYVIESLYSHYMHTMYVEPLEIVGRIISEKYPKYKDEFKKIHSRRSAHMFNMLIMKKEILNEYCEWLFGILSCLEKEVRRRGLSYDEFHTRFYGRISELLLDVYIRTNNIGYKEVGVISIQPVKWITKVSDFLAAKFFGKKYEKSF